MYDLEMKKKVSVFNCTDTQMKRIDCIMNFIASKMNCSILLEKTYFPKNYPLCTTQKDLQSYYNIRLRIYQGLFDEELKSCHENKCKQKSWVSNLQGQHVVSYSPKGSLNDKIAAFSFQMSNKEVNIHTYVYLCSQSILLVSSSITD